MKRKFTAGLLTLALGALLVPGAFAANADSQVTTPNSNNEQFYNQMFDWHKSWVDQAVKNGQVTEEQAKNLDQQFEQMKEFHIQNGMGPGMMGGMMGNFNGNCFGSGTGNFNGNGFGPGMMGNFNSQSN